ncbi:class I SAM-dependent methyltransferase [Alphaproteobacteria bacterium]|nr:class I SAM-dependent methyltransferase [Alphaproteobacteria bacterium]
MKKQCICCNSVLAEVFSLGKQPLANKYPKLEIDFKTEYIQELIVYLCDKCGYCHVPCEANRALFFEDYYYLSSINTELVSHFEKLAEKLLSFGVKFVLDVGSNDGVLLKPLKNSGIKCLGIDPSFNVGEIANSKGLETFIGFFDQDIANRVIAEKGRPDMIVASSVFTHLDNPGDFFDVSNSILDIGGAIIIEVEFLNDIIESIGFERFYYDRPHYYSVDSLRKLSEKHGFTITDVEQINAHGGSIQITFQRTSEVSQENIFFLNKNKIASLSRDQILSYFNKFKQSCEELRLKLLKFKQNNEKVAGYSCPARLSTITNFAGIGPDLLPFVIDDTPLKQGRHTPGFHIPIIPFENSPQVQHYLVFAYEYIDSIRAKIPTKGITYFKPVPFKVI